MGSRQKRQTDGVYIFLQGGFGDLFGGLVQTGLDDLESVIAKGAGDGFCPTIMAVEARLGNDYSIGPLHK